MFIVTQVKKLSLNYYILLRMVKVSFGQTGDILIQVNWYIRKAVKTTKIVLGKINLQHNLSLIWVSYEQRDNKRVSHFLFYLPTFCFLHEINQRFDKIIAITKTLSILSQWTYFSSQTFQKIQCNVSGTFVLNYYLLQTLIKVSINLRDRRKISVMKWVRYYER